MLNVLFRETRNIRNRLSHALTSFAKHEISRNKDLFSRNTKLVSHEILEHFVRKKLECQPYDPKGVFKGTGWIGMRLEIDMGISLWDEIKDRDGNFFMG